MSKSVPTVAFLNRVLRAAAVTAMAVHLHSDGAGGEAFGTSSEASRDLGARDGHLNIIV